MLPNENGCVVTAVRVLNCRTNIEKAIVVDLPLNDALQLGNQVRGPHNPTEFAGPNNFCGGDALTLLDCNAL